MSEPTAEPAIEPDLAPVAEPAAQPGTEHPAPRGLLRITPIIATIGVVVALVGLVLLLRPVETETQDCGTSIGFLLDGRVNEFVNPADLPEGTSAAEAQANNDKPCRQRVADQAKPAAMLIVAGVVTASGAAVTEATARGLAWRKRARERHEADEADEPAPSDAI